MSVPAAHAVVHAQIELHDRARAGDSVPCPPGAAASIVELTSMPATSGDTPPSGWPTGRPFNVVESAT